MEQNTSKFQIRKSLLQRNKNSGSTMVWVALLSHSKKASAWHCSGGLSSCVEIACSPCASMGFLLVYQFPPTVQRYAC